MDLRSRRKGSKEVREGRERGGIEGGRRGDTENAEVSEEEGRLECMGGGGGERKRRGREREGVHFLPMQGNETKGGRESLLQDRRK